MRTFECPCGNKLYFENATCLNCGGLLGYLPNLMVMARIEPAEDGQWRAATAGGDAGLYRKCRNYGELESCNWMVPAGVQSDYCHACTLNSVIPDISDAENMRLWFRIEQAKRRLIYTLDMLELPVLGKSILPERGLAFEFLRDRIRSDGEFSNDIGQHQRILTGHMTGIVTINAAEANAEARERMREEMGEAYRTLLGHFRHEIAHYYWDILVRDSEVLPRVRELFGDERQDYDQALSSYYADGPPPNWPASHISAYASAHPWEDWAESWAHYMHMDDTLETAWDAGLSIRGRTVERMKPGDSERFQRALEDWAELTEALNALNRSMGLPDAYPFAVGPGVAAKLRLIDEIIANSEHAVKRLLLPSQTAGVPTGPA